MSATISINPWVNPTYDEDIELVCDRCNVKISDTEKGYEYELEIICEECEERKTYHKH